MSDIEYSVITSDVLKSFDSKMLGLTWIQTDSSDDIPKGSFFKKKTLQMT